MKDIINLLVKKVNNDEIKDFNVTINYDVRERKIITDCLNKYYDENLFQIENISTVNFIFSKEKSNHNKITKQEEKSIVTLLKKFKKDGVHTTF